MSGKDGGFDLWKSFADLGLGLTGAMAIAIVLILQIGALTQRQVEDLNKKQAALKREKSKLEAKLKRFDEDKRQLASFHKNAKQILQEQDTASCVLALLLQGGCQLEVDEYGTLRPTSRHAESRKPSFYGTGEVKVTAQTAEALSSCVSSFERLADCLSPPTPSPKSGAQAYAVCGGADEARDATLLQRRHARCTAFLQSQLKKHHSHLPPNCRTKLDYASKNPRDPVLSGALKALSSGVEALVLEGNADAEPYRLADPVFVSSTSRRHLNLDNEPLANSFVLNTYLGAERARQALGHLVHGLKSRNKDQCDALPVMLNKLRVESGSFGRFQTGPLTSRQKRGSGVEQACPGRIDWSREGRRDDGRRASLKCDDARSLRLHIRWSQQAMRAPYKRLKVGLENFLKNTKAKP